MSLSRQEEEVLAGLAAALRADDPALAEALGSMTRPPEPVPVAAPAPVPVAAPLPVPLRDVVDLCAMFMVLIVVAVLRAADLDIFATAAVTCVLAVPWLIVAAFAAERSSDDGGRPAPSVVFVLGRPLLGTTLILCAVAALPRFGHAVLAAVLMFVAMPCFVVRLLTWVERRTPGQPEH